MCCGRKRKALTNGGGDQGAEALGSALETKLLYLRRPSIQMRGSATGRLYQFSPAQPMQSVDSRDATSLLRTRLFRQTR